MEKTEYRADTKWKMIELAVNWIELAKTQRAFGGVGVSFIQKELSSKFYPRNVRTLYKEYCDCIKLLPCSLILSMKRNQQLDFSSFNFQYSRWLMSNFNSCLKLSLE